VNQGCQNCSSGLHCVVFVNAGFTGLKVCELRVNSWDRTEDRVRIHTPSFSASIFRSRLNHKEAMCRANLNIENLVGSPADSLYLVAERDAEARRPSLRLGAL
jgi:hypothetical protein